MRKETKLTSLAVLTFRSKVSLLNVSMSKQRPKLTLLVRKVDEYGAKLSTFGIFGVLSRGLQMRNPLWSGVTSLIVPSDTMYSLIRFRKSTPPKQY